MSNIVEQVPIIYVYAICKNESKNIDEWIKTMRPADGIYVLDTGSTDDSFDKLQKWAAQYPEKVHVYQHCFETWRFDDGRNYILDLMPRNTANNIIYFTTDLDERMADTRWAAWLRTHWTIGYHERANYVHKEAHRTYYYNWIHDNQWRWVAPVHEYLIRRTNEKNDWNEHLDQSRVLHCGDNLVVEHHPDRAKSRAQYFKLLEMRLQECPTDASAHYYYAMELVARNDMQAIEHYIKAAEFSTDPLIKCGARANAGTLYGKQHDERYKECFIKAIEYEGSYLEPYYWYSSALQENGDVQAAYEILLSGLKCASGPHHTWLELGESLYIRDVWVLLTIYSYILKKYTESAAYAAIAYKNCPHDETVQFNWKVCCEALQKQLTEANLYGTN